MKWNWLFNTMSLLVVTLAMLGCSTFNRELDSAKRFKNYPKPIYGWDTTLTEKYTKHLDKNKDNLYFVVDYNNTIKGKQIEIDDLPASKGTQIAELEKAVMNARKEETTLQNELEKLIKKRAILEQARNDLSTLSVNNQAITSGNIEVVDNDNVNKEKQSPKARSIEGDLLPAKSYCN